MNIGKAITSFCLAIACVVSAFLPIASRSQARLSGAIVVTTTRPSAMQGMAEQPDLYCGRTGGRVVGCWGKDQYDQWAREQGQIERNESIGARGDGTIFVGDWDENFVRPRQTIRLEAGNPQLSRPTRSAERIPLGFGLKIQDPRTGQELEIDSSTSAGRDLRKSIGPSPDVTAAVGAAASGVQDFIQREQRLEQQRQRFEDHLRRADATTQAQLAELRQHSANVRAAAEAARGQGLAQAAQDLFSTSAGIMTSQQRTAYADAKKLAGSALRHAEYSMNHEAATILEREFANLMKAGRFDEAARVLDKLNNAVVNGKPYQSKSSSVNQSGVMKIGGLFDQRNLQTNPRTSEGQIVRRLMNRYQAMWSETNALSVLSSEDQARYLLGSVALSVGEENFADGDIVHGSGLMALSEVMIDSIAGFGVGLASSVTQLVKSVPEIAHLAKVGASAVWNDPVASWNATLEFVSNLDEFGGVILAAANKEYELLKSGTPYQRGDLVGRYAIDVVTLVSSVGTIGAVKQIGKVARVSEAVEAASRASSGFAKVAIAVERAVQGSADVRDAVRATSIRIGEAKFQTLDRMPRAVRVELLARYSKSPRFAVEMSTAYNHAVRTGSAATVDYLEKLVLIEESAHMPKSVRSAAAFHEAVVNELKTIKPVSREGFFSRGLAKEFVKKSGEVVKTSEADVLKVHWTNLEAEHRLTMRGEQGIYFTEGKWADAKHIVEAETNLLEGSMWHRETEMKLGKILDLTDPTIVDRLRGLKLNGKLDITGKIYDDTQAIGHAARSARFEGVLFDSGKVPGKTNLLLFQ